MLTILIAKFFKIWVPKEVISFNSALKITSNFKTLQCLGCFELKKMKDNIKIDPFQHKIFTFLLMSAISF